MDPKNLISLRCRKPGHRVAVCRAPSPVLAVADSNIGVYSAENPKQRLQQEGAGHPTGRRREHVPLVATRPPSPAVLHAQLYATKSSSDKCLIVLSVDVHGASHLIRALLDSGNK